MCLWHNHILLVQICPPFPFYFSISFPFVVRRVRCSLSSGLVVLSSPHKNSPFLLNLVHPSQNESIPCVHESDRFRLLAFCPIEFCRRCSEPDELVCSCLAESSFFVCRIVRVFRVHINSLSSLFRGRKHCSYKTAVYTRENVRKNM